jgi:predicted RNase H-like HicB family nuclease
MSAAKKDRVVMSQGETIEELEENMKDAIKLILEFVRNDG